MTFPRLWTLHGQRRHFDERDLSVTVTSASYLEQSQSERDFRARTALHAALPLPITHPRSASTLHPRNLNRPRAQISKSVANRVRGSATAIQCKVCDDTRCPRVREIGRHTRRAERRVVSVTRPVRRAPLRCFECSPFVLHASSSYTMYRPQLHFEECNTMFSLLRHVEDRPVRSGTG